MIEMWQIMLWQLAEAYAAMAASAPDWLATYYMALHDAVLNVLRAYGWPV